MTVQLDPANLEHVHLDRDHLGAGVHALTDRVAALRHARTCVAASDRHGSYQFL